MCGADLFVREKVVSSVEERPFRAAYPVISVKRALARQALKGGSQFCMTTRP